jgi:RimJ/RimL family protein N-acetyltransferase
MTVRLLSPASCLLRPETYNLYLAILIGADSMNVEPIILEGRWARLEPLAEHHAADLTVAAQDEEIWRYMPAVLKTEEQVRAWIIAAQAQQATGSQLPFAIVERATGRAIGSTRYLNITPNDRGL